MARAVRDPNEMVPGRRPLPTTVATLSRRSTESIVSAAISLRRAPESTTPRSRRSVWRQCTRPRRPVLVAIDEVAGAPQGGQRNSGSALSADGEWSRHSDLNRGPAVYELDRPERYGTSVESRALGAQLAGLPSRACRRGLRGGRDGRPDRTPDGSSAGRSLVSVMASALRHPPLARMGVGVVHHVCRVRQARSCRRW